MIALIDYGAGNLTSVRKAFAHLGADVRTARRPADLGDADAIVVPGVGHFQATAALGSEWHDAILARVGEGRPLLGICLGMQWLFEGSDEAPDVPGIGLIPGTCALIGAGALRAARDEAGPPLSPESSVLIAAGPNADRPGPSALKVPHVGWNSIHIVRRTRILETVEDGAQVYFTHSYAAPVGPDCVATTTYGETFAAVVERGQIAAVQFHPEKSGTVGLTILRNFLERLS